MLIVDAQVHMWGPNTTQRPWPDRGPPQREAALEQDELLREMDTAGVHRTIIVPPIWEGDRNDLGLAAARALPDRFAVMGRLNPESPDAKRQLTIWRQQPGMLGIRFSFTNPAVRPLLTEGRVDWVWGVAEKAGVPIYLLVTPEDLPRIDAAAERHPGLKLVLDHLAIPTHMKDAPAFAHIDSVLALAKRPNIAVKVSALPCYTAAPWPYLNLHPMLRRVYDSYGPERMFWGSDLSRLPCSYRECVTMFTEEMPWLKAHDLEWIMGRGVCAWLGWPARWMK